jgi:hypothetical protein
LWLLGFAAVQVIIEVLMPSSEGFLAKDVYSHFIISTSARLSLGIFFF